MKQLQVFLLMILTLLVASVPLAQGPGGRRPHVGEKPCDFVTKSEAESILDESVVARRDGDYQCWFVQDGFTSKAPANKQVSLSVWYFTSPHADDVNERRADIAKYGRTATTVVKDVADFADAAIWTWTPGWGGRFNAFKGGTIQVEGYHRRAHRGGDARRR